MPGPGSGFPAREELRRRHAAILARCAACGRTIRQPGGAIRQMRLDGTVDYYDLPCWIRANRTGEWERNHGLPTGGADPSPQEELPF